MTNKEKIKEEKVNLNDVGITDRLNIIAIFKIKEDTDVINLNGVRDDNFKKIKKPDYKILREEDSERTFIYVKGEFKSEISTELFEKTKKVINEWFGNIEEIYVNENENYPIIFVNKPMAIIIAPRIENDK